MLERERERMTGTWCGRKEDYLEEAHTPWTLNFLSGKKWRAEQDSRWRIVNFPHAATSLLHPHGGQPRYRGNSTSTTKYTLLTFLPKSLFEQYR